MYSLVSHLYIGGVTNGPFSPGTCIVLYADDILLYHTISSNLDYSYIPAIRCQYSTELGKL